MEFKGTKGKWFIVRGDVTKLGDCISIAEKPEAKVESRLICLMTKTSFLDEVDIANALLISKAPEMLEMLKRILHEYQTNMDLIGDDIQYEIENLIKEATTL